MIDSLFGNLAEYVDGETIDKSVNGCTGGIQRPQEAVGTSGLLQVPLPDSRKPSQERRFHVSDPLMKRLVTWSQKQGNLVDAKQCIGVENKGDEELTEGEFRITEWCPPCV